GEVVELGEVGQDALAHRLAFQLIEGAVAIGVELHQQIAAEDLVERPGDADRLHLAIGEVEDDPVLDEDVRMRRRGRGTGKSGHAAGKQATYKEAGDQAGRFQSAPSAVTVKLQPQVGQPTCSLAPAGDRPLAMRASRSWRAAAISPAWSVAGRQA